MSPLMGSGFRACGEETDRSVYVQLSEASSRSESFIAKQCTLQDLNSKVRDAGAIDGGWLRV